MNLIVSGVKPTGSLTLGNYIGALSQFVKLQDELNDYTHLFFVADMHALTTYQDKTKLKKQIKEVAALYIASGLDPKRVKIFIQSEVMEHLTLGYIMESTVYMGELERMTQFKDKKVSQKEGIRASLFTYPALMAADILLYDATLVPVGDDQKQHLELTRTLAERFNSLYGNTFTVPKPYMTKTGSRIKDLQNPLKKMSKSDDSNPKGYILLLDNINEAKNKIKSAITDSDTKIIYDEENKPGISNLLTIYSSLTNHKIKDLELKYQNKTYKDFKLDLSEIVGDKLKEIQDKYYKLINSKELDDILDEGREFASILAKRKMDKVYQRLGLKRTK